MGLFGRPGHMIWCGVEGRIAATHDAAEHTRRSAEETLRRTEEIGDEVRRLLHDPYWTYQQQRRTFDWMPPSGSTELQISILRILRRLVPHKATGVDKVRLGSANDGGYVMLDDFAGVSTALSFGVERNADWDLAVVNRGVGRVLQFDHTIDSPPSADPRLIWTKRKIGPNAGDEAESIVSIVDRILPTANAADLVLKLDIEHDEWPLFDATPAEYLGRFRQIVGEFHGFDYLADMNRLGYMLRVFKKLTATHALVHVHANNHCGIANIAGVPIPFVLEMTFANRSSYDLVESNELFPGRLDAPCDPSRPDFMLGTFRF